MSAHSGIVKLIIGPMFASKTSTLIAEIERSLLAGKKCVIIKASIDTRYDHLRKSSQESIITHNGVEYDKVPVICAANLADVGASIDSAEVIGIMEAQFYPDVVAHVRKWAASGHNLIVDALSGDYEQKPFDVVSQLISEADYVIHRDAVCMNCQAEHAPFTMRKSAAHNQPRIHVGEKDEYMAVCRRCRDKA